MSSAVEAAWIKQRRVNVWSVRVVGVGSLRFAKRGQYTREGLLCSVSTRASDIWQSHVAQQPIALAQGLTHENPAFRHRGAGAGAGAGAGIGAGAGPTAHGASAVEIAIQDRVVATPSPTTGAGRRRPQADGGAHGDSSNSLKMSLLDTDSQDEV